MQLSRRAWALGVMLALNIIIAILLTPLGFESRPPGTLTPVGYFAIATVFLGVALDVAAIVFLFRNRTRLASSLAIAGSVLFIVPNVVDRAGSFFSLPIPPAVDVLEYLFMVVIVLTLVLAWQVRAQRAPGTARAQQRRSG